MDAHTPLHPEIVVLGWDEQQTEVDLLARCRFAIYATYAEEGPRAPRQALDIWVEFQVEASKPMTREHIEATIRKWFVVSE